jgi:hypothetical protein
MAIANIADFIVALEALIDEAKEAGIPMPEITGEVEALLDVMASEDPDEGTAEQEE